MIYKASNLIAEAFDEHDVRYRLVELEDSSLVEAGFFVSAGPELYIRFISSDDENDVSIRIYGLLHRIPAEKRSAVIEACNELSGKIRFFKFYLDGSGNVNAEADLPMRIDDGCIGECCFELFVRSMHILDNEYHVLAEALYDRARTENKQRSELMRLLSEMREKPIVITDGENA